MLSKRLLQPVSLLLASIQWNINISGEIVATTKDSFEYTRIIDTVAV